MDLKRKFVVKNCEFILHEDNWNDGEGKLMSAWNENVPAEADTIEELLKNIPHLEANFEPVDARKEFICDPCCENDFSRFEAMLTVDVDNGTEQIVKPTEEKWKLFTEGKVNLFTLQITVRVVQIEKLDGVTVVSEGFEVG